MKSTWSVLLSSCMMMALGVRTQRFMCTKFTLPLPLLANGAGSRRLAGDAPGSCFVAGENTWLENPERFTAIPMIIQVERFSG